MSTVKCLLVDDLDENLRALSAVLKRPGVEIFTATSGAKALDLLLSHDMALAILDVQMPEMDGFELAELMRGSQLTQHIPLIFVTAGNRDNQRLFLGYEHGAVDFLYKPVNPQILSSKAEVFFELYRQRQRIADELEARTETLRFQEIFMAILGHDLRNPLHSIALNANLIRISSDDSDIQRSAADILATGSRMNRLIDDLLDVARIRLGGGMSVKRQPLDLGAIVQRAVNECRALSPSSPIEIATQGDLCGQWDADRLAQVFSNLLGNALQHGKSGGAVLLQLDGTSASTIVVSMSNAGAIPESAMPHLFDPFRGGSLRQNRTNLGLGLYIVHEIVRAHGGQIKAASHHEMTTFTLHLPREG